MPLLAVFDEPEVVAEPPPRFRPVPKPRPRIAEVPPPDTEEMFSDEPPPEVSTPRRPVRGAGRRR